MCNRGEEGQGTVVSILIFFNQIGMRITGLEGYMPVCLGWLSLERRLEEEGWEGLSGLTACIAVLCELCTTSVDCVFDI